MTEAKNKTKPSKKLAIIDGKSVFYRGYYAMPGLSTSDGTPTGGVYGFAVMALEVIKRLQPDYVCVAWDKPKTNIRRRLEMYPKYKAGRKPPPADFYTQIPLLHDLLSAFGWPLYELDDYEADDIMGALAVQAAAQNIETLLITSDMDMLQLVNDQVQVYALKKGLSNIELFHPASFTQKYGLRPDQFLDLKALKGDSSDNIPGVPGVGEKGAIELLKTYETLDGVYENLGLLRDSLRKKLEAGKDLAYLSKDLAAIWTDAPIKLDLKTLDVHHLNPAKVAEQLQKLEFRTLVRQLPDYMHLPPDADAANQAAGATNGMTASGVSGVSGQAKAIKTVIIDTPAKLADAKIGPNPPAKQTTKTDQNVVLQAISEQPHGRQPLWLSVSPTEDQLFLFDLSQLDAAKLKDKLAGLLRSPIIGYDLKSSLQTLRHLGLDLPTVSHDVLIGSFLINSLQREQSLSELAANALAIHLADPPSHSAPAKEIAEYQAGMAATIRALAAHQQAELAKTPSVQKLAAQIEWPIIPVLAAMEYRGMKLDSQYLMLMADQVADLISDIQQQIYGLADQEFNIASPAQLATVLFEELRLPTTNIKKGRTGYSTAASELAKLRNQHPIIDFISQFREYSKLKNTYIDTLPQQADQNGRIHSTFNLTVAQTGRLSSTDPNLQNIPVRTDLGKQIRTAFITDTGFVLVSADYSQFELRLAAVLAEDEEMISAFNRGIDIHTLTAAQVYDRQPEEVTKNMRREAKVINFGIMYGLSTHGLAVGTGMSYEQAKHFIDKYFQARPKLKQYIDQVREQAKTRGYVETLLGRRRPTPDIHSSNFAVREAAYRAAVNMPFQGSAADIMKKAMIDIHRQLSGTQAHMILQVHDSVMVECPEDEAKSVAKMLKTTMEAACKLPVELTVETSIGQNWGEL